MADCEYQSPFGDGWRGTHATVKQCTPQDPFDACMEECGNRWGASETNMKLGGTAECMNDSAEDAIKFLLHQHGYLAEMEALMGNEEFKVMAEKHGIDLGADATAHTVVHDMYHAEDGRAVAESIQNLETVKLQEKMEIGKFFLSLYEVMDESNKATGPADAPCDGPPCEGSACDEEEEASAAGVGILVASISAALGAILM